jgi:xanthine dehydrogenase YagS FAD-binding subunit
MKPFEYVTAVSAESAANLVKDGGRFFSGGIDLLGEMKEYIAEPNRLVNVKSLPGTRDIKKASDALFFIGANVTVSQIAAHDEIGKLFPGLAQAAAEVGSPQIRSVATLAGNLAQHSRCWYYRHRDVHCLKKGGATCYAREGENKYHSLFSGNPCISPAVSNLAVALAALDGRAYVRRGKNLVTLSMAELYHDAWVNPLAHHSLGPADLITGIEIGIKPNTRSAYLQVSEKSDFDWALVSCAAAAELDGKTARNARIALGQIAPVPYYVDAANESLEGKTIDKTSASHAADLLLKDAQPLADNGYKIPLAHALIRRTLMKLVS